jgi:hypothetical protein
VGLLTKEKSFGPQNREKTVFSTENFEKFEIIVKNAGFHRRRRRKLGLSMGEKRIIISLVSSNLRK